MVASVPDLLRLVVLPLLGWAAWRDIETRRVPSVAWYPLVALGAVLLVWESLGHLAFAPADQLYFLRVGISLLFVAIAAEFEGTPRERVFIHTSEPESGLIDRLETVRERFDVSIGSYPGADGVRLRIESEDGDAVTAAAEWLRERIEVVG